MVDNSSSSALNIFDMGMGPGKKYLENEIEILKSRTTSERAIKKLLKSEYRDNLYILGTREFKMNFWQSIIITFKIR